jgi:hypothetical protein
MDAIRTMEDADSLIAAIYSGNAPWSAIKTAMERKQSAIFACVQEEKAMSALMRLWYHPALRDSLSSLAPVIASRGAGAGNTMMDAVLHIARQNAHWLRDPEDWDAPKDTAAVPHRLLASLLRHLFEKWPMPPFLDETFLLGEGAQAETWRACAVYTGVGIKIKSLTLPVPLTDKGRHYFLLAPPNSTFFSAVRWGQTLSLGGTPHLATMLTGTKVCDPCVSEADETFVQNVLHFFINHPEVPPSQIGPVVDYLWSHRFGDAYTPPDPTFTMKGRGARALLESVTEWHDELAKLANVTKRSWPAMALAPFVYEEKTESNITLTWSMVELTDAKALQYEGSQMRHCILSYATGCLQGKKAIFSLRLHASDTRKTKRMLTIEVNRATKSLAQVRGYANALPKDHRPGSRLRHAGQIARHWARERKLGIGCAF